MRRAGCARCSTRSNEAVPTRWWTAICPEYLTRFYLMLSLGGALVARYRLPEDAAFALFAVARSVGLLAHSMEQLSVDAVIRPRGRYTGPTAEVQPKVRRLTRKGR